MLHGTAEQWEKDDPGDGGQRTTDKGKNERDIAKITMELKPSFPPYPTVMLSQCLSVESKMIKLLGHNKAVTWQSRGGVRLLNLSKTGKSNSRKVGRKEEGRKVGKKGG